MACEHRQNLSVEPLHSAANSPLCISQRPFDLVQIACHIVAFDSTPPISDLNNPCLHISQHRRYRGKLSRIIRRIRLLRSHTVVLSETLCKPVRVEIGTRPRRFSSRRRRAPLAAEGRLRPAPISTLPYQPNTKVGRGMERSQDSLVDSQVPRQKGDRCNRARYHQRASNHRTQNHQASPASARYLNH